MQETLRYIIQRMQETLYLTDDARVYISDSGCRNLFIRQWMQETISDRMQDTVSDRMQESQYQTADARDYMYIRQRTQETPYQTADARDTMSDSGCRRLYQTVDAGVSIPDNGCKRLYIRQPIQESLYQTADADYITQQLQG